MRLRDRVDIVNQQSSETVAAAVPAHVGFVNSAKPDEDGWYPWVMIDHLVIILPAGTPWNGVDQALRWKDELWEPDGHPAERRMHGRAHHITIQVKKVGV